MPTNLIFLSVLLSKVKKAKSFCSLFVCIYLFIYFFGLFCTCLYIKLISTESLYKYIYIYDNNSLLIHSSLVLFLYIYI
ncbi:hypothetical protein F4703DRAFT_1870986 [Phycomyces blakesleeanus]